MVDDRRTMGNPAGPGLRYTVVKTYALDGIKRNSDLLASSSGEGTKQSQQTAKNITGPTVMPKANAPEISTEKVEECPQPGAKRGIQSVTTEDDQAEDADTHGKLQTPKIVKLEPTSADQTAAKQRNKRTK